MNKVKFLSFAAVIMLFVAGTILFTEYAEEAIETDKTKLSLLSPKAPKPAASAMRVAPAAAVGSIKPAASATRVAPAAAVGSTKPAASATQVKAAESALAIYVTSERE